MIVRQLSAAVLSALERQPAVAINGPRQVGKSTLVRSLTRTDIPTQFLDLELAADRERLLDAEAYLSLYAGDRIVIDEVQLMPQLFGVLRPLIDADRRPGRFILTGSASPSLIQGLSQSLAGRIAYLELTPISLAELDDENLQTQHWFRGGFPNALLAGSDENSRLWLDEFIRSYIFLDFNQLFGVSFSPSIIQRFWQMLAHHSGGLWNGESFGRSLGVSAPTATRYLDYLEGAYMVRRLMPWFVNTGKRLVKSPKVYIRDSGLLHRLAGVRSMHELLGHLLVGASWEGYVIEQIMQRLPADVQPYFYRTHAGAECDLVLVRGLKPWACIEIKRGASKHPGKGFYEVLKTLEPEHAWCIVPGNGEPYPIGNAVWVWGLERILGESILTEGTY